MAIIRRVEWGEKKSGIAEMPTLRAKQARGLLLPVTDGYAQLRMNILRQPFTILISDAMTDENAKGLPLCSAEPTFGVALVREQRQHFNEHRKILC